MVAGHDFPLAYVILAHDNWPHLERLVDRLAAEPQDTVVIHMDGRVPDVLVARVRKRLGRPNIAFANRIRCQWGHISLVEATFSGLRTLVATGRQFRYASLLSGVDYPIRPLTQLRRFLSGCGDREFIEGYSMYFERWVRSGPYAERYEFVYPFARYAFHHRLFQAWEILQAKLDRRRSMPQGLVPFSGSQWWTLTQAAIHTLLAASRDAELMAFFRTTFVPDEMMIQTIIMNSACGSRVAFRNLRWVRWEGSGWPHIFVDEDFAELKAADAFFARKITVSQSPQLVRRIDAYLL